mmetsp:Transcript_22985/g.62296  ORF Transcript_22985/g.62296 Transcript_22985/m.62296 type:complete len:247 (+) Transcript_22985:1433-2173(+)
MTQVTPKMQAIIDRTRSCVVRDQDPGPTVAVPMGGITLPYDDPANVDKAHKAAQTYRWSSGVVVVTTVDRSSQTPMPYPVLTEEPPPGMPASAATSVALHQRQVSRCAQKPSQNASPAVETTAARHSHPSQKWPASPVAAARIARRTRRMRASLAHWNNRINARDPASAGMARARAPGSNGRRIPVMNNSAGTQLIKSSQSQPGRGRVALGALSAAGNRKATSRIRRRRSQARRRFPAVKAGPHQA